MSETTKIRIGPARFSYANVWKPRAMKEGDTPKYSISILIPKSDKKQIAKIKKAIEVATKNGKTVFKGRKPTEYPLHDGDKEKPGDGAYEGMMYINAKSDTAPGIMKMVNGEPEQIEDQREFYSGCHGYVTVNFFPFNKGSIGVGAGLNHILKVKDDTALSGKGDAATDFADLEIEDDEEGFGFDDEDGDNLGGFD
jgi:hypothetical protein